MSTDYHPEEKRDFSQLQNGNKPAWSMTQHQEVVTGMILDLSPFGGRLLLPRGTHFKSDRLLLVVSDDRIDNRIRLTARILWSRPGSTAPYIETGCEFLRPSNQSKLALMQLIRVSRLNHRQFIVRCKSSMFASGLNAN